MRAKIFTERLSGFLDAIEFNETISANQSLFVKENIKLIIDTLDEELIYPSTLEEFIEEAEEKFGKTKEIGSPYGEFEYRQDDDEDNPDNEDNPDDEEDVDFDDVGTVYKINDDIEASLAWFKGFYQAIDSVPLFKFKTNQILLLKEKLNQLILEIQTLTLFSETDNDNVNE